MLGIHLAAIVAQHPEGVVRAVAKIDGTIFCNLCGLCTTGDRVGLNIGQESGEIVLGSCSKSNGGNERLFYAQESDQPPKKLMRPIKPLCLSLTGQLPEVMGILNLNCTEPHTNPVPAKTR